MLFLVQIRQVFLKVDEEYNGVDEKGKLSDAREVKAYIQVNVTLPDSVDVNVCWSCQHKHLSFEKVDYSIKERVIMFLQEVVLRFYVTAVTTHKELEQCQQWKDEYK